MTHGLDAIRWSMTHGPLPYPFLAHPRWTDSIPPIMAGIASLVRDAPTENMTFILGHANLTKLRFERSHY